MIIVANGAFGQSKNAKFSPGFATALSSRLTSVSVPTRFTAVIPANFYTANLGFFCKQELKFEAKTKIPFKFRLGGVQECDRLEGKGNLVE